MSLETRFNRLTRLLYPTGRAFRIPDWGNIDKLNRGLDQSQEDTYNDATGILNSILPDNDNFTTEDAAEWERRLGLITNAAVDLENRKAAIQRKMNHPGNIPARGHYLYLEAQLQLAGFDLYIHENRYDVYPDSYEARNPLTVSGGVGATTKQHGQFRHGQLRHGQVYTPTKVVANSIDPDIDAAFDAGSSLVFTFFVGGDPAGTFVDIPAAREKELRQLILRLKPTHTVAYLFVNYV